MPVRVGVIGVGYLGQHHARLYAELGDASLAGVVDVDPERAAEVARTYDVKAYTHHKDILGSVDALSIVVPTTHHYEIALDCIRAGKDVLVEKPVTVTVGQANELVHEAEKMGSILQVGHLEQYNPGVIALTAMIDNPRFIEATRVSPFLSRNSDVDVTLDLMIHDIDVILSVVRSPLRTIRAAGYSFVTDKIDEARAWIEFENDITALLTASRMASEKKRVLRIFQEDAVLELDYQKAEIRRCQRRSLQAVPPGTGHAPSSASSQTAESEFGGLNMPGCTIETVKPEYREPLKRELADFLRCVTRRERPKVSGIEGRDALRVALAISTLVRREER